MKSFLAIPGLVLVALLLQGDGLVARAEESGGRLNATADNSKQDIDVKQDISVFVDLLSLVTGLLETLSSGVLDGLLGGLLGPDGLLSWLLGSNGPLGLLAGTLTSVVVFILTHVVEALLGAITDLLSNTVDGLGEFLLAVVSALDVFLTALTGLLSALTSLSSLFNISGLIEVLASIPIGELLSDILTSLVDSTTSGLNTFVEVLTQILASLTAGLPPRARPEFAARNSFAPEQHNFVVSNPVTFDWQDAKKEREAIHQLVLGTVFDGSDAVMTNIMSGDVTSFEELPLNLLKFAAEETDKMSLHMAKLGLEAVHSMMSRFIYNMDDGSDLMASLECQMDSVECTIRSQFAPEDTQLRKCFNRLTMCLDKSISKKFN